VAFSLAKSSLGSILPSLISSTGSSFTISTPPPDANDCHALLSLPLVATTGQESEQSTEVITPGGGCAY
jgi:hypothetical protein